MQVFIKIVLSTLIITSGTKFFFPSYSQQFEGEIYFTKESPDDTSHYSYKIKGDKVRVEELDNNLQLINYMIVNLSSRTIIAVNPNRKLYVDMPVHFYKGGPDTISYKIIKTENSQIIMGYKCYQWRVQNKKDKTEIVFWVSKEQFNFFFDFLKIVNRAEKSSVYFLTIPNTRGYFPFMSVERTMLREQRMQLLVTKIQKKSLPLSLFEIPADYKMFQKN